MCVCAHTHIHIHMPTQKHITVDSFLLIFVKLPMKEESLKGHTALYFPMQTHRIFGYFPSRHIKSKTTIDLKILVLVYSKAKMLKLK